MLKLAAAVVLGFDLTIVPAPTTTPGFVAFPAFYISKVYKTEDDCKADVAKNGAAYIQGNGGPAGAPYRFACNPIMGN